MDVYSALVTAVQTEYDTVRLLKESARGRVALVRRRSSGERYVFRQFEGGGGVYRRLLEVTNPHLPVIYEAGSLSGRTAVLEEYVRGDTLAFLLEAGELGVREARDIARQLCEALWVLHSMGAVHRDIKPENVLLRGSEAVLIDFDAARFFRPGRDEDTQVLGTTGYAAPEQYGLAQSDARADIYSLGVLLNVMLTRRHPSRVTAPGRMGRIVQKCTMINPERRYQSALDLMEAL